MNKFFEIVGKIVIGLVAFVFLVCYILPRHDWEKSRVEDKLCNYNKNWFEWVDFSKKTCIEIPNNL